MEDSVVEDLIKRIYEALKNTEKVFKIKLLNEDEEIFYLKYFKSLN